MFPVKNMLLYFYWEQYWIEWIELADIFFLNAEWFVAGLIIQEQVELSSALEFSRYM